MGSRRVAFALAGLIAVAAAGSAGGPPFDPALPLPAMRMRCPSRVPGLMRTSMVSLRGIAPSPPQTLQVVRSRPVPPQRGQGTLNFIPPLDCVIWPLPPHCGHFAELSRYPRPEQLVQVSVRATLSLSTVPFTACQKGTVT